MRWLKEGWGLPGALRAWEGSASVSWALTGPSQAPESLSVDRTMAIPAGSCSGPQPGPLDSELSHPVLGPVFLRTDSEGSSHCRASSCLGDIPQSLLPLLTEKSGSATKQWGPWACSVASQSFDFFIHEVGLLTLISYTIGAESVRQYTQGVSTRYVFHTYWL